MRNQLAIIEKNFQDTRNQLEKWADLIFLIHPSEWVKYEEDGISIIDEFKTVEQYLMKVKGLVETKAEKKPAKAEKKTTTKKKRTKKEN